MGVLDIVQDDIQIPYGLEATDDAITGVLVVHTEAEVFDSQLAQDLTQHFMGFGAIIVDRPRGHNDVDVLRGDPKVHITAEAASDGHREPVGAQLFRDAQCADHLVTIYRHGSSLLCRFGNRATVGPVLVRVFIPCGIPTMPSHRSSGRLYGDRGRGDQPQGGHDRHPQSPYRKSCATAGSARRPSGGP
ncbi:hypothetical protein CCNLGMII_00020 [Pseudomonas phage phi C106]|nr:hypothetical protein CCNLGMII_00020 [Pseudomonas phage phi C106]